MNGDGTIFIVDIGGSFQAVNGDAAKAIADGERRVLRHGDVIFHGERNIFVEQPTSAILFGIIGANQKTRRGIVHVNLNRIGEFRRVVARSGRDANGGDDVHIARIVGVHADVAELVLDAHRFSGGKRHRLIEIARDLVLHTAGRGSSHARAGCCYEQRRHHNEISRNLHFQILPENLFQRLLFFLIEAKQLLAEIGVRLVLFEI